MAGLDDYELVRVLARGGMGVVHEAVERATGRRVALKRILGGALDHDAVARFLVEGRALARLDHPAIVRVHTLGQAPGGPFMVMDLVPGESLQRALDHQGPLAPERALEVARALAGALEHAHAHGVLHRDLKPANVLVDEQGDVRLIDFGLARLQVDGGSLAHLTRTGEVLGTPAFMAPEQADGQPVDARTDVYGLGATLYALLAGKAPFEGANAIALLHAVLTRAPTPPSQLRPGLSPALDALVLECLAKEPARRPASMRALLARLDAVDASRPAGRRPAAWVVGGGLLVAATVAGLALVVAGARPGSPGPPVSPGAPAAAEVDPRAQAARLTAAGEHTRALAALEAAAATFGDDDGAWLELLRARARAHGVEAALAPPPMDAPVAARLAHARALLSAGRPKAALDALVGLDLLDRRVALARLEALRAAGDDVEGARAALDALLAKDDAWPAGLFARALLDVGDDARSKQRSVNAAIERLPALGAPALAARLEAALAMRTGEPGRALTALGHALAADPASAPALVERAGLLLERKALDDAARDLDQAVLADPLHVDARRSQAALERARGAHEAFVEVTVEDLRLLGRGSPDSILRLGDAVTWLQSEGRPDLATRLLEQVEPTRPDARVQLLLASARRAADDRAGVVAALTRLLKECPPDLPTFEDVGKQLAALGQREPAWDQCYVDALERQASLDLQGWGEVTNALLGRRRHAAAERAVTHAIELDTGVGLLPVRARCRSAMDDLEGALADWDRVVATTPGDWGGPAGRAEVHAARGDLIGALSDVDLSLQRAGTPAQRLGAQHARAQVCERVGDLQGALAALREVRSVTAGDDAELDARLADLERRAAADAAALEVLRRAVLAAVTGTRGAPEAARLVEESRRHEPTSPRAALVAAWVLRAVGRTTGSEERLRQAEVALSGEPAILAPAPWVAALRARLQHDREALRALGATRDPGQAAGLLRSLGLNAEAAEVLGQLEAAQARPAITFQRAGALLLAGDLAAAEGCYRRLIPDAGSAFTMWARMRLAELELERRQPAAALRWADEGLAATPAPEAKDAGTFRLERARALLALDRPADAVDAARAAEADLAAALGAADEREPEVLRRQHARARAVHGEALARLGQEDAARDLLLDALRVVAPLSLDDHQQAKREVRERALRSLPEDAEVQRWAHLAYP